MKTAMWIFYCAIMFLTVIGSWFKWDSGWLIIITLNFYLFNILHELRAGKYVTFDEVNIKNTNYKKEVTTLLIIMAFLLSSCASYPLQSKVVKKDPKAKSHIGR